MLSLLFFIVINIKEIYIKINKLNRYGKRNVDRENGKKDGMEVVVVGPMMCASQAKNRWAEASVLKPAPGSFLLNHMPFSLTSIYTYQLFPNSSRHHTPSYPFHHPINIGRYLLCLTTLSKLNFEMTSNCFRNDI